MTDERGELHGRPSGRGSEEAAASSFEPGWHVRAVEQAETLRGLYTELEGLAEGQRSLIDDGEIDRLLELLERRGGVIQSIAELTRTLRPVMEGWERLGASVPDGDRTRLESAIADVARLNGSVLQRDEQDASALLEAQAVKAKELAGIGRGRSAIDAYSGGIKRDATARFQDRKA